MRVAHLVKTKSLLSDGRILKWIESLKKQNIVSEVFVLEDKNEPKEYNYNNQRVTVTALFFRKFFKKHKGFIFKIPEFSVKTYHFFRKSTADVFVFHDVQHYLTLLYLCLFKKKGKKKLVWDLHELPHTTLSKIYLSRKAVQYILAHVDLIVYTNEARRDCILKLFPFKERKYVVLNNYPQQAYIQAPKASLPNDLKDWLQGLPYVLWMGAGSRGRNFLPLLKSMKMIVPPVRLVVMGSIQQEMKDYIERNDLTDYVFCKFVRQEEIIQYVDNALFSVVLYRQDSLNNMYCEPNRLYQLVTRSIPVIVGNNPPMETTVRKYKAGIVLPDGGHNETILAAAINRLCMERENQGIRLHLHTLPFSKLMSWDDQFRVLVDRLRSL